MLPRGGELVLGNLAFLFLKMRRVGPYMGMAQGPVRVRRRRAPQVVSPFGVLSSRGMCDILPSLSDFRFLSSSSGSLVFLCLVSSIICPNCTCMQFTPVPLHSSSFAAQGRLPRSLILQVSGLTCLSMN